MPPTPVQVSTLPQVPGLWGPSGNKARYVQASVPQDVPPKTPPSQAQLAPRLGVGNCIGTGTVPSHQQNQGLDLSRKQSEFLRKKLKLEGNQPRHCLYQI